MNIINEYNYTRKQKNKVIRSVSVVVNAVLLVVILLIVLIVVLNIGLLVVLNVVQ